MKDILTELNPMKLKKNLLETETHAASNWGQLGHRRIAIDYAVAGIKRLHDANLEKFYNDPFSSEMEGMMRSWVIETLLQGAYLREYHLWEKDCKAYFVAMALRNSRMLTMKTKGGQSFTDLVRDVLGLFAVAMPSNVLDAVERMRDRVNHMKHSAGLELDHFITENDYMEAVEALECFWITLSDAEVTE